MLKKGYLDEDDFETEFGKKIFREYFGIFSGSNNLEEKAQKETSTLILNESKEPINLNDNRVLSEIIEVKPEITSDPIRRLDFYSITQYLQNNQVVGEEANGVLITLALANKIHTILEGDSGSGKSYLMKNILKLFDGFYELGLSSDQAIWYQAEEINSASLIYMPELQKVVADKKNKISGMIEFLKSLGEGKNIRKVVTNKDRDGVDSYEIFADGKVFATTIANENSFKYDRELQRRFLILETDNSKEHIDAIINDKVSRRMMIDIGNDKESLESSISKRISSMNELQDVYVLNPFLGYLEHFFPRVNRAQSYLDHYLNLFDAAGKFFYPERKKIEVEDKKVVILNLEDVFNICSMYHPHFLNTLQSFNENKKINQASPDWNLCIRQGMNSASTGEVGVRFDDKRVLNLQDYPKIVDDWIGSQLEGSKIYTTDYRSGEKIEIANLTIGESELMPLSQEYDPFLVDC